jgi:hypothetical protein
MAAFEQEGVDNEDGEERESPVDPRQAIMDAAAEQADRDREIDPEMRQEDMPMGEPVNAPEPGLQSQELMHPEAETEGQDLGEYADDPLAEFIELAEDGAPMFRTVVNGQQALIPLDRARAQLQKHESAELRLQQSSEWQKQLEAREAAIQARETEIREQMQGLQQNTAADLPTEGGPQSDEDIQAEAKDIVHGLFNGTEDEAAEKLADALRKSRGAPEATPTLDPEVIVQRAVEATRQTLTQEELDRNVDEGYKAFVKDYPEIAADEELFAFADSISDAVLREHPDWTPGQVMHEAGKRVSERVGLKSAPEPSEDTLETRQERKQNLRRIPLARQGTQETEAEEKPDTPADVMDEIRASRGQVV